MTYGLEIVVDTILFLLGFGIVCAGPLLVQDRMLASLPEIRGIKDEELREYVKGSVIGNSQPSWVVRILGTGFTYGFFVGTEYLLSYFSHPRDGASLRNDVYGAAWAFFLLWMSRASLRKSVRRKLAERGVLVCLHCGYDLRGQTVCRCPECGKAFDPQRLTLKKGALYAVDCWREKE